MTTPALSVAEISTLKIISMELAMECALVAALFSVVGVPIMLMVYIFFPRSSSSCEDHVALAEQHGALPARMSRQIDAALAEHRAALQQEMDAMKGAISETVSDMRGQVRNLKAHMREMQHGLRALDERVPRLESEQCPPSAGVRQGRYQALARDERLNQRFYEGSVGTTALMGT